MSFELGKRNGPGVLPGPCYHRGGEAGIRVFASRIRTPPSQARSGETLKTRHRRVFLTILTAFGIQDAPARASHVGFNSPLDC